MGDACATRKKKSTQLAKLETQREKGGELRVPHESELRFFFERIRELSGVSSSSPFQVQSLGFCSEKSRERVSEPQSSCRFLKREPSYGFSRRGRAGSIVAVRAEVSVCRGRNVAEREVTGGAGLGQRSSAAGCGGLRLVQRSSWNGKEKKKKERSQKKKKKKKKDEG
ncbi:hypothetical protein CRG98_006626 [Punica granatum]|uniref:Uncharacterized protein n=1 Tax=Punica granatum TaxID=22663 RepID=A0A2I0KYL5_PUNGR|nr:hypothetical protein CRG98_006626 [Punica granatum]